MVLVELTPYLTGIKTSYESQFDPKRLVLFNKPVFSSGYISLATHTTGGKLATSD